MLEELTNCIIVINGDNVINIAEDVIEVISDYVIYDYGFPIGIPDDKQATKRIDF